MSEEFFQAITCRCGPKFWSSHFTIDLDYNTVQALPRTCGDCGKFQDELRQCYRCRDKFFQHFVHPFMGYRSTKGWICWNCCERARPIATMPELATRQKMPPPKEVLPPGYELFIYQESPALIKTRGLLDGI